MEKEQKLLEAGKIKMETDMKNREKEEMEKLEKEEMEEELRELELSEEELVRREELWIRSYEESRRLERRRKFDGFIPVDRGSTEYSSKNQAENEAQWKREQHYIDIIRKSDGFNLDLLEITRPPSLAENFSSYYSSQEKPHSQFLLYAKLGIHRYNMLQGKKLQYSSMVKFNYLPVNCSCRKIFITCIAKDPDSGSLEHFQSGITVQSNRFKKKGRMVISCFIARPRFAEKPPVEPLEPEVPDDFYSELPQWPSDFEGYYLVKKSELPNYDWIRLYLELAFTKANTYFQSPDLAKLVIKKVAVQTGEPQKESFESGNTTFFIKYKYLPKKCRFARDRICIIRRTINKKTGLGLRFSKDFKATLL